MEKRDDEVLSDMTIDSRGSVREFSAIELALLSQTNVDH